jgi:hypothetical protein
MAVPIDARQNEFKRQLATLSYAHVRPSGAAEAVSTAGWWNMLAKLGCKPPLCVVHDLGLLIARSEPHWPHVVRLGSSLPLLGRYEAFLAATSSSEVIDALAGSHLRDETVAVILARLIGNVYYRWSVRPRGNSVDDELPLISPHYTADRASLARESDVRWVLPFLQHVVDQQAALLARRAHSSSRPAFTVM